MLAIWGVGLAHMLATQCVRRLGGLNIADSKLLAFFSRVRNQKIERKEETAKLWLEMASSCLIIGGFLERPDLEGANPFSRIEDVCA